MRMDNDDLNALTIIGSIVCKNVGVCKSNEHGIEGGRAIRVCGRRHSTLAIGVSDPKHLDDLADGCSRAHLPNVKVGMES